MITIGFYDHISISPAGKIIELLANIFGSIFVLAIFLIFLNLVSLSNNE